MKNQQRLMSLDALRGFDMFLFYRKIAFVKVFATVISICFHISLGFTHGCG